MKKLRIELEIEVKELSEDEQAECREQLGDDEGDLDEEDGSQEPSGFSPDDYDAGEFAELIEGAFYDDAIREMFAGSNIYVTFGDARVIRSAWAE